MRMKIGRVSKPVFMPIYGLAFSSVDEAAVLTGVPKAEIMNICIGEGSEDTRYSFEFICPDEFNSSEMQVLPAAVKLACEPVTILTYEGEKLEYHGVFHAAEALKDMGLCFTVVDIIAAIMNKWKSVGYIDPVTCVHEEIGVKVREDLWKTWEV